MITSDKGIELIKSHEGLRLDAYLDAVNIWTIGYGHTGDDVYEGLQIDEDESVRLLRSDLHAAEDCVDSYVDVKISQEQFDALVSLVYNIGCKAFRNSTLLKLLNGENYEGAAEQFHRWNKAGGKVLAGLTKRRQDEFDLFVT